MRQRIRSIEKKLTELTKKARISDIIPFTEKPSEDPASKTKVAKKELAATELFSLFTADIIREEVIFTR